MKKHIKISLIIVSSLLLIACATFSKKSETRLYEHGWPAFSLSYPAYWLKKTPDSQFIFGAEALAGFPALRIAVMPNMDMPLQYSTSIYLPALSKIGKHIKVLYDKEARLKDGTPAQEVELEWVMNAGIKLNSLLLTAKKDKTWILVVVSDTEGRIEDDLRKIPYSLQIKPVKEAPIAYSYKVPEQTNDGWQTAHVTEVNLDEKILAELIKNILNETYTDIHSVLIIKDGKLVLEEYFPGQDYGKDRIAFTRDDLHGVMSVTKSFVSTLIGIAVDKGMIKGTDEDLVSFFPEHKKLLGEHGKEIKLRHVLSMTAGFDWDETTYLYSDRRNPYWIMLGPEREHIIEYILSRPIKSQPGFEFTYNGGLSLLLGTIVEKSSSLKTKDFAQQYLFGPLGISQYEWGYWDAAGKVLKTDGGLYLLPRDMAKFGYLFVNRGKWKGQQIISAKWIEEATKEHIKLYPTMLTGYGYQWWLYEFTMDNEIIKAYVAAGWGGQYIFVFPALDMIVVFTAGNYSTPHGQVFNMMYNIVNKHVLPARSR
jgi:CubicO group peptidase (beta-lactamase class C family)